LLLCVYGPSAEGPFSLNKSPVGNSKEKLLVPADGKRIIVDHW
jgi:hypothetical protein